MVTDKTYDLIVTQEAFLSPKTAISQGGQIGKPVGVYRQIAYIENLSTYI